MQELINFIKSKCTQEEIQEIVNELSTKDKGETQENNIPKTWEAYCNTITEGYFINASSNINKVCCFELDADKNKNLLPTKELASAFLAMMQLMSLRQAWIKDWKPDWRDDNLKWTIYFNRDNVDVSNNTIIHRSLSFPTEEMAKQFVECFKSLIEQAKVLI